MPQILSIFLMLSSATESKQKQTLAKYSGRQRVFNIDITRYKFSILRLFNIPIHFFIFRTYKQTRRLYGLPVELREKNSLPAVYVATQLNLPPLKQQIWVLGDCVIPS